MTARLWPLIWLWASPVGAEGALGWVQENTAFPLEFQSIANLTVAPGGMVVADALTAARFEDYVAIPVPAGPARLVVALDPAQEGRVSKALLIFGSDPVVCGKDVATVGVDTGLAGFFDEPSLTALNQDAKALGPEKDLYNDWFDALIGQTAVVAQMAPLPSGAAFPMVSTGWGDGSYPVATLNGAGGEVLAVYVDFMGRDDDGTWLLPQPCAGA